MTREIVLDTETTGFDPDQGDRIIEIGCVELFNHLPTGKTLQLYINPEREIPAEATAIHGITNDFIKDKPVFSQVYEEFLDFVKGATLVIHNAEFDMKFINWELRLVGHEPIGWNMVLDTLGMARKQFPGSPANLDALCRRFGIDNTERTYHGALLDSSFWRKCIWSYWAVVSTVCHCYQAMPRAIMALANLSLKTAPYANRGRINPAKPNCKAMRLYWKNSAIRSGKNWVNGL